MIDIIICDDSENDLLEAKAMLQEELPAYFPDYTLSTCSSGEELLQKWRLCAPSPTILFLDIYLSSDDSAPAQNGIEIASLIRQNNYPVQIIFLSSSRDFIMESYYTEATYYLVKPITKNWLRLALEKASVQLALPAPTLTLKIGHSNITIVQSSINYLETFGNKTYIHTAKEDLTVYRPLRELATLLEPEVFLLIQRGILANMNYIASLQNNICTLKNHKAYQLSRKNSASLREKYFDFLFKNP